MRPRSVDVVADVGATDFIGAGEELLVAARGCDSRQPVEDLFVASSEHCGTPIGRAFSS